MNIFTKHSLLFLCLALIGMNCKTSEPNVSTPPVSDKQIKSEEMVAIPDTTRFLNMTINGRVKYEFTKTDSSWTGVALQYDTNDPQTRKVVRQIPLSPAYGWSDFEDMVQFLKIYTLPDQSEIDGHQVAAVNAQSRSYRFTVYDGEKSRSYFYFNPEGEASQYWQSQNVITFGSYIITEMQVLEN